MSGASGGDMSAAEAPLTRWMSTTSSAARGRSFRQRTMKSCRQGRERRYDEDDEDNEVEAVRETQNHQARRPAEQASAGGGRSGARAGRAAALAAGYEEGGGAAASAKEAAARMRSSLAAPMTMRVPLRRRQRSRGRRHRQAKAMQPQAAAAAKKRKRTRATTRRMTNTKSRAVVASGHELAARPSPSPVGSRAMSRTMTTMTRTADEMPDGCPRKRNPQRTKASVMIGGILCVCPYLTSCAPVGFRARRQCLVSVCVERQVVRAPQVCSAG